MYNWHAEHYTLFMTLHEYRTRVCYSVDECGEALCLLLLVNTRSN